MKLIITIDTEEDNWTNYSRAVNPTENIKRMPSLQQLFDDFNVKPTYLINYPVATDRNSINIIKKIFEQGRCEIGTHCHPWNTPPFGEDLNTYNTMMSNLPADVQYKKISFLHQTIINNFNTTPVSFRCGRWGYNQDVGQNLYKLGYKIDTSITPYTDWTDYDGSDFSNFSPEPFRFSSQDVFLKSSNGNMIEVPASIGFLQNNFKLCNSILKSIKHKPLKYLRLTGLLYKMNLLNKVWLSPETEDSKKMIRLTKSLVKNNIKVINMSFHSPSLMHGLTPFVNSKEDEKEFLSRIKDFLMFTRDSGIESIKLSDTVSLF